MSRRDTGFPKHVLEMLLARSGGDCEIMAMADEFICKIKGSEAHHRRPKAAGGTRRPETNYLSNGLMACTSCHRRIHDNPLWARDNGFLVSQYADPAQVPVWWRSKRDGGRKALVLLDNSGTIQKGIEETA